jgi:segregation and condensation protein A
MKEKEAFHKEEHSTKQEQVHDLLFSKEIGWKDILYDLINTDQLDPWDIDITILSEKYLEKIQKLEEQDFFISSKVLLAAALILRIKSEILLNEYIKSIDEILFGKKETSITKEFERIELDDEIPELIPKSPIPRFRKVTLNELMESLNKAIITENRRIKREIIEKNAVRESSISLPKRTISIKDKIKEIHEILIIHLQENEKVHLDKLIGKEKENKISVFSSLLHLENQKKIWIHQEKHFGDIHIWHQKTYFKNNDPFEGLREED